jgi:aspartyl-tRNA(Asn)/glutamyl-tRNA(Gln) amidotransferase subunit A
MSSIPLYYQTVAELTELLTKRHISAVELMQTFIERTQAVESKVKAFISFDPEHALLQARASDERRAQNKTLGLLDGVPIGIKDILAQKDAPLTCASRMLKDYVSPYDATVIQKLRSSGAILWGRLNMDEFAMGSSNEHSYFHKTFNPWNLLCVPGGSSGGSAAAVSAGEAPITLGTDTGGSIRQPAAFCGIAGLKPTYGRVSRYGLAAFASSLDQIGLLGRTLKDIALFLEVISGQDPLDSTSYPQAVPNFAHALEQSKAAKRLFTLGVPEAYFSKGLDPEIAEAVQKAVRFYEEQGCQIKPIELPSTELAVAVYYIISTAEASSNLARYDGIRYTHRSAEAKDIFEIYCKSRAEGFGDEVKRRILLGTYVLSSGYYDAFYIKAQKARVAIRNGFTKAFKSVDAILTPTTPTVAFKIGQRSQDPFEMYLSDAYTIAVNLAGLPALSIPCGFNSEQLPIGFQLIGKPFQEETLLAIGNLFEHNHTYHTIYPNL